MDKDQKKLVAIFRFGVISDVLSGTTRSVVNGRGYCGTSASSGGRFSSPILEWVRLYRQRGGKL
ncbi:hypothetical protein DFAR_150022 [Desulfarculales bacterium]